MVVRFYVSDKQEIAVKKVVENVQTLFNVVIVFGAQYLSNHAVRDSSDSGTVPAKSTHHPDSAEKSILVEIHGEDFSEFKAEQYLVRLISEKKYQQDFSQTFLDMVEKKLGNLERKYDVCINRSGSSTLDFHGSDDQLSPVVSLLKECYSYFQENGTVAIDAYTEQGEIDISSRLLGDFQNLSVKEGVKKPSELSAIRSESPSNVLSQLPSDSASVFGPSQWSGKERTLDLFPSQPLLQDYENSLDPDSIDRFGLQNFEDSENLPVKNVYPLLDSEVEHLQEPLPQTTPAKILESERLQECLDFADNAECLPLVDNKNNSKIIEEALKLGYSKEQVEPILKNLGPNPDYNDVLGALVSQGPAPVKFESLEYDEANRRDDQPEDHGDEDNLKPIIIDGSNVAMSYGNNHEFAVKGIEIVVNWFLERGHKKIYVIIPSWRKERSPNGAEPITDQHLLREMEDTNIIVYTPSRRVQGQRIVSYDDRYIVKAALQVGDGIIVSNDHFRDLIKESDEFKRIIEENLLMYSFVDGKFMPPDDPLGRKGPSLDDFLRKRPLSSKQNFHRCPYGDRCTYGNRCKYDHPERRNKPMKSISETIRRKSQPAVKTWKEQSQTQPLIRPTEERIEQGSWTEPIGMPRYYRDSAGNHGSVGESTQRNPSVATIPIAHMSSNKANRQYAPYSEVIQSRYDFSTPASSSTSRRYQQELQRHEQFAPESARGISSSSTIPQYHGSGYLAGYSSYNATSHKPQGAYLGYQQTNHGAPERFLQQEQLQYHPIASTDRRFSLDQQHTNRQGFSEKDLPRIIPQNVQNTTFIGSSSQSDSVLPGYYSASSQYHGLPTRDWPPVGHSTSDMAPHSVTRPPPGFPKRQDPHVYKYGNQMLSAPQQRGNYNQVPYTPLRSGMTDVLPGQQRLIPDSSLQQALIHDPSLNAKERAKREDILQKLVYGPLQYDYNVVKFALEIDPKETEVTNIIYHLRELKK